LICHLGKQPFLQAGLEAVDEDAWRAQARQPDHCRGSDPEFGIQRQLFEIEFRRRYVFAKFAGAHLVTGGMQGLEQFRRDKVDLAQIRRPRISAR
jgi:hypothetical protein